MISLPPVIRTASFSNPIITHFSNYQSGYVTLICVVAAVAIGTLVRSKYLSQKNPPNVRKPNDSTIKKIDPHPSFTINIKPSLRDHSTHSTVKIPTTQNKVKPHERNPQERTRSQLREEPKIDYSEILKKEPLMGEIISAAKKCGFEFGNFKEDGKLILSGTIFSSTKTSPKEEDPSYQAANSVVLKIRAEMKVSNIIYIADRTLGYGISVNIDQLKERATTKREAIKSDKQTYKVNKNQAEVILSTKGVGFWLLRINGSKELSISRVAADSSFEHTTTIPGITITEIAKNAHAELEKQVVPQYDKLIFFSLGKGTSAKADLEKYLKKHGTPGDIIDLRSYDRGINEGNTTDGHLKANLNEHLKQLTHQSCCYFIGHCSPGNQFLTSDNYSKEEMAIRMRDQLIQMNRNYCIDFPSDAVPDYNTIKPVWQSEISNWNATHPYDPKGLAKEDSLSAKQIVTYFNTYASQLINKNWKQGDPRIKLNFRACFAAKDGRERESFVTQLSQALNEVHIPHIIHASEEEENRITFNGKRYQEYNVGGVFKRFTEGKEAPKKTIAHND